ncbi:MAG TPA: hypothetical protein VGH19_10420 [Verrucomicrobiae bacterium]
MFTLVKKYVFKPDDDACCLTASYGYSEDFSWTLQLQSQSHLTSFPNEAVEVLFGMQVHPLVGRVSWYELIGKSVEMDRQECGFRFDCDMSSHWEDIIALRLRFGQIRGAQLEVFAEGRASVEAAPDIFPDGEVEFHIHAWAKFSGVAIHVPLNAADPIDYATAKIKTILPRYAFVAPVLRRTSDDKGLVRAVEVLFKPKSDL